MVNIWSKLTHPPRRCLLCGDRAGAASCCEACRAELPWNDCACDRCGIPLAAASDNTTCGRCLQTPPPFDAALCAFHYRFPVDRLLVKLKFHGKLGYARELGALLAERIEQHHGERLPEAIAPVPLHPRRARNRGFNQAAEIARAVGARLDLPVVTDICARHRDTAAQSSLSAAARQANIRGAFSARRPLPARRWAIVDDVVTTGATAGEVARALLAAGASSVLLWTPARA
ncbi:MAG TPA: ComF family protein [Gammaproteobacteria bacterium]|nr:ComF family protein [Gammaproteobacteria bacterium]